jgi:hypothetical protein
MPAKTPPEPDPTPAATTTTAPAPTEPGAVDVPDGRLPAGTYAFTGSIPTQYLDVPITARPAYPERPATDDDPGAPATPATVFDWPFSAPDDGRWEPSKKKPNQVADNAAPLTSEE